MQDGLSITSYFSNWFNTIWHGAFREVYEAKTDSRGVELWVIKKYRKDFSPVLKDVHLTIEEHAKKQVQMHSVAKYITDRFSKDAPEEFDKTFAHGDAFYAAYDGTHGTVEPYYAGDFLKYIKNDSAVPDNAISLDLNKKAGCLAHYSFEFTKRNMVLLDIQGTGYTLYDPEIL